MSAIEEQARALAGAAMGCTEYVMGHNKSGKWGMVKEALAMRSAVADAPSGPAEDLIARAQELLSAGSESDKAIDATDKDLLVTDGRRLVTIAVPVLSALPQMEAEQVRAWLLGIARRVAEASKDKGGSVKISEAEETAIEDLRQLLS